MERFSTVSSPEANRTSDDEIPGEAGIRREEPPPAGQLQAQLAHTSPANRLQLFQALIEGAKDYGIFMVDTEGCIVTWNEGASRIKGYAESEIVGRHFSCFYTPEDIAAGHPETGLRIARTEGKFENEGWRVRRDGSRFLASVLITALWDSNGILLGFSKLTRDITERKEAEERVLQSERNLRQMADSVLPIMWTARADGEIDYVNRRWYEFANTSKAPSKDELWEPFVHPDDVKNFRACWQSAIHSGNTCELELRLRDPASGAYRWYVVRASPVRVATGAIEKWIGTATDIDQQKELNRQLERTVDQKTTELQGLLAETTLLLREVHHRVKNNMQVIGSLLSMQIDCTGDRLTSQALKEAHSRVLTISLVHEKIYQSESVSGFDLGDYVQTLSTQLFSAYCIDPVRTRLEMSVESISLTMNQAIPCGLILNELLSNALKHAFSDGREGVIQVSLRKSGTDRAELSVADNGIGLPADFEWQNRKSFGMEVIVTLIRQLRAEFSITSHGGTSIVFCWPLPQTGIAPELPVLRESAFAGTESPLAITSDSEGKSR